MYNLKANISHLSLPIANGIVLIRLAAHLSHFTSFAFRIFRISHLSHFASFASFAFRIFRISHLSHFASFAFRIFRISHLSHFVLIRISCEFAFRISFAFRVHSHFVSLANRVKKKSCPNRSSSLFNL